MRGRAEMRDAERLSVRIENAVAAIVETGGDPAPILAALSRIADAAERGTPCLADAVLSDPPDHDARTVAAKPRERLKGETRMRRRKWGAVDLALVWQFFFPPGRGVLGRRLREAGRGDEENATASGFVRHVGLKRYGPGACFTARDLGCTIRTEQEVKSCLRAVRDRKRRGKT